MAEACQACSLPVISGNVSFYNESSGKNIIPTSAVGMIGIQNGFKKPRYFFEKENENIYLVYLHEVFINNVNSFFNSNSNCFYGHFHEKKIADWIQKWLSMSCELQSVKFVGRWGLAYTLASYDSGKRCGC